MKTKSNPIAAREAGREFTIGQTVFVVMLVVKDDGTVKCAEVRERRVTEYHPNYCKLGPRWAACAPKHYGKGSGYGLAYHPGALLADRDTATELLRERLRARIENLQAAIDAI